MKVPRLISAGEEVGALRVDVVETDLSHSGLNLPCDNDNPIAILKGNRREKPVRIFPAAQARNVFFRGNEPAWIGAWLREDVFPSRTCIALEAYALSSTATLSLQARLGGPAGPILDSHPVTAFELQASAETRAPVVKRFDDGSILCWATITMSPFIRGIDMHLHMWGEGGTFGDSTTDIHFSSADFDQDHVFHYDMVWRKMGSLCHSWKTYQDGVMIGK